MTKRTRLKFRPRPDNARRASKRVSKPTNTDSRSSKKAANEARLRKQMLMDEKFGLIEYHARIIANWRTRASADYADVLLSQAARLYELVASLRLGQDHTMGGYDVPADAIYSGTKGLQP
jgi:hypothetical protein